MRVRPSGTKASLLGCLLLCSPLINAQAEANTTDQPASASYVQPTSTQFYSARNVGREVRYAQTHARHVYAHPYGISCVPYARQVSGIMVVGNAWQWWTNAAGEYARGYRPEPGSVLAFKANGRMRLGHVAVVERVINAREVIVDHANWPSTGDRGAVSHNVAVVDVSEANNWSAVRVQLANRDDFGSVYPTYGFIYNRPDSGVVTASVARPAPQAVINPVPSDLRPVAERPWHMVEEVAQYPASRVHQIDMRVSQPAASPRD
jgi:surface antigen